MGLKDFLDFFFVVYFNNDFGDLYMRHVSTYENVFIGKLNFLVTLSCFL